MAYRQIKWCNTINCDPEQWLKKAHPNTSTRSVIMDIRPLTCSLGAEIIGADIKDDQQFEAIN